MPSDQAVFPITDAQRLATISAVLQLPSERWVEGYEYLLNYSSVLDANGQPIRPLPEMDPAVWVWLRGAIDSNKNEGQFSRFIRDYTKAQYLYRTGQTLSEQALQNTSNDVVRSVLQDVLRLQGIPSITTIGNLDANAVISGLFGGNQNAWSGVILFPFLGVNDYLNTLTSVKDSGSTYDVIAALSAISEALGSPIDIVGAVLQTFGQYWPDGLGPTLGTAQSTLGQLWGFLSDAYGVTSFTARVSDGILGKTQNQGAGNSDVLVGDGQTVEFIHAGNGDDTVRETLIGDIVDGGSGTDTFDFSGRSFYTFVTTDSRSYTGFRLILRRIPFDYTALINVEILKLGSGDDETSIHLPIGASLKELDTGMGDDGVAVFGAKALRIYLGSGNDVLRRAPSGSIVQGDSGADTFWLQQNVLIADATPEDRLSWMGLTLHGGIQRRGSESPWAWGLYFMRYGLNGAGELVVRDPLGRDTFVAKYDNTLSAPYTAGIKLIELELSSYFLIKTPNTWQLPQTMEALLGHAAKALTGVSAYNTVDPLLLDLDGDGFELLARTSISPRFDSDADGFAELTGWVRGDDGLLARDVNGNGLVDGIGELFGTASTSGFQALAALDGNSDGRLDAADAAFAQLRVWRDANGNAVTDPGELTTLGQAGIVSISATPASTTPQTIAGNVVTATSSFTRSNGSTGTVGDVQFSLDQRDTRWLGDSTVSAQAQQLPEVKGYGTLTDLRIAMTASPALMTAVQQVLPQLDTLDLRQLRDAMTPMLGAWAAAVPVPVGTPGQAARQDVPILVDTSLAQGVQLLDFAFERSDAQGTFWALGSGQPVKDAQGQVIERPTQANVLTQTATQGAWTVLAGGQIQFLERRLGTQLPLGLGNNLTGSAALEGAATILEFMWQDLNEVGVRVAMQGPLASYFAGIRYDAATDRFLATTDRKLVPTLEAILGGAPSSPQQASSYLQAWTSLLDVFLQDFHRGEDYLQLSYSYLFQNVVAAYENVGSSLTLAQAASALGMRPDLIRTGTGTLEGGSDADLFYLGTGDQLARGGLGPDGYIVGKDFGHDVIDDMEPAPGEGDIDLLRFAHLRPGDVVMRRDGVDLVINVVNKPDELRVQGQFSGRRPGLTGGYIDDDRGVGEIGFADGTVFDRLDIARAVSASSTGATALTGTRSIDFLAGLPGDDTRSGGDDGDVYGVSRGRGRDRIEDRMEYVLLDGPDIVQFDAGIEFGDVSFLRQGNSNDLQIAIRGTDDMVTIAGQFDATYTGLLSTRWLNRIEGFAFSDGNLITSDEVLTAIVEAGRTDGDDTIFGFSWPDTIDGGPGNDFLSGGNEDDSYLIGLGYGNDVISEQRDNILSGGTDTLRFLPGIAPSQASLSRQGNSDDLRVSLPGGATVDIVKQFDLVYTGPFGVQEFNRVERFEFDDGTVWDPDYVMQRLLTSAHTDGDDSIFGFAREDMLGSQLGDDYLAGGKEGDIYSFGRGYGHDTVFDEGFLFSFGPRSNTDELRLLGLNPSDIIMERPAAGEDILLRVRGTDDTVLLKDQTNQPIIGGNPNEIERLSFADGTTWSPEDLRLNYLAAAGTAGSDRIRGFFTADVLNGGPADDRLEGGGGGDEYRFNVGSGHDTVYDDIVYVTWDQPDRVAFGPGLLPENMRVSRVGYDLEIEFAGVADRLTIEKQYWSSANYNTVENFVFSNGVTLTHTDMTARAGQAAPSGNAGSGPAPQMPGVQVRGKARNDVLRGTAGTDRIIGGKGNDALMGGPGSDTYIYQKGDGKDVITEGPAPGDTDLLTVKGRGLTLGKMRLERSARDVDDVFIRFKGVKDSILLDEQLSGQQGSGVERIQFGNGVALDLNDLIAAHVGGIQAARKASASGMHKGRSSMNAEAGERMAKAFGHEHPLARRHGRHYFAGTAGHDLFAVTRDDRSVRIDGFAAGGREDAIVLHGIPGVTGFNTIRQRAAQAGRDTVITLEGTVVTLRNVQMSALSPADFICLRG